MNIKLKLSLLAAAGVLLAACEKPAEEPPAAEVAEVAPVLEAPVAEETPEGITGKFVPPDNKILMFIGQDSDMITEYVQTVSEDNMEGVTLYTQLKSADPKETLLGVFSVANWNSGDVDYGLTLNESPGAALAIGMAFDKCGAPAHGANIANGEYDDAIVIMNDYFKSIAPRKVFLRFGYEFDGPWNCYDPETYKAAFRYVAEAIDAAGVENVTMVWQSAAWPDASVAGDRAHLYDHTKEGFLDMWYPGDDVVDWVSMSIFYRDLSQWNYTPPDTPARSQDAILDFARARGKPVMVAESAPQGYRLNVLTHSPIQENKQTPMTAEQIWDAWFVPYFDYIYANKDVIRSVAYINAAWETQGMWVCEPGIPAGQPGCNSGNWGDTRVQANDYIKAQWLKHVNNEEHWIQTSDY